MQKALYFIPDISGFTKFVHETEIEHSIHIIAELLEILLDNNTTGFELAEIEGDALFMYTTEPPAFAELIAQINKMLESFHQHIHHYNHLRICDCGACRTAVNLNIKFILHYGNLNFIKIKEFEKPYGTDVIRIHRLLKNKIDLPEYILITEPTFSFYHPQPQVEWQQASDVYDHQEATRYFFKDLESEKQQIVYQSSSTPNTPSGEPVFQIQKTVPASPRVVHTLVGDWSKRTLWDEHVKRIEPERSTLNQVGAKHTCILDRGDLEFMTIREASPTLLSYGETTDQLRFIKRYSFLMQFHETDTGNTQVIVQVYLEFSRLGRWLKPVLIQRLRKNWDEKLTRLGQVTAKHLHII